MHFLPVFWGILAVLPLSSIAQFSPSPGRCPAVPDTLNLSPLTDPFTFFKGRPVRTKEDWACRRAEIAELVQRYTLGHLPSSKPKVVGEIAPDSTETNIHLNISVTEGETTVYFSASVSLPTDEAAPEPEPEEGAVPGKKSFPALILMGGYGNIPKAATGGLAMISFPNDLIARQEGISSRGKGVFYDLYGADHPAGSLIAWAWGVSRLIDALEQVKEAKINTKRIGVTGCSRNGRGAMVAGAFDSRIALTIPQEGGAGGSSCWRIQDHLTRRGINVQTASQIVTENTWFSRDFELYVRQVGVLPYDQHLVTALIAPRALFVPENGGIDWLGPEGAWGCQSAARTVWKALGVEDRIGFAQTDRETDHQHCILPEEQLLAITAFVDRFLKGKDVETAGFFGTEAEFPEYSDKYWRDWQVPNLR